MLIDFTAVILEMSVVEKQRAVGGEKGANLAPKKCMMGASASRGAAAEAAYGPLFRVVPPSLHLGR